MKSYHTVLSIAGSDSGGGAGIQADLKTFSALGCYGCTAITAITAQNTQGVQSVQALSQEIIRAQVQSVMDDLAPRVIKIGMLPNAEAIRAVSEILQTYRAQIEHIILDPVMVASSGDSLMEDQAIESLKAQLMPLATLVTPNLEESKKLTYSKIENSNSIGKQAEILAQYCPNVLIKGGHHQGDKSSDLLYQKEKNSYHLFEADRIDSKNLHGTGCSLSSAIAAYLAKGENMLSAIKHAKAYVHAGILAGKELNPGKGIGPIHHFHEWW